MAPSSHWWHHRAELMVTCLATRPHWLLASTIPFSRSRCPTPNRPPTGVPCGRFASAEPTLTSRLGRRDTQRSEEPRAGPARGVRVNASGAEHRGRTRDCMARIANLQPAQAIFRPAGLASPPMGSSGMKRKGRKHQPKVGTKQERDYALHQDQRAVAANFGITRQGRDVLDRDRRDHRAGGRRRGEPRPVLLDSRRHRGPGHLQARRRAQLRRPSWRSLPSTSAGATSRSASVTTSPSSLTPPCTILRRPSLFDRTAVGNERATGWPCGSGRHARRRRGSAPRGHRRGPRARRRHDRTWLRRRRPHRRRGRGRRQCGRAAASRRRALSLPDCRSPLTSAARTAGQPVASAKYCGICRRATTSTCRTGRSAPP